MKQTAGIVFLMALMGAPAAAQRPVLPADYQPPPSPSTAGQPSQAPRARDQKKPKDPYADQKLGPLGMFPLSTTWLVGLPGPPTAGATSDGTHYFVATPSTKQIVASTIRTGATAWATPDLVSIQPLVADSGRVFVILDQEAAALDATTGKPIWRLPTKGTVSAVPAAKAGWLILALDTGEVRALRGETGETVWDVKFNAPVQTRPVIIGDRLYVAPQNKHLVALDIVSGHQLWDQEFEGSITAIAAQDQRIFVGTDRMFFGLDHAGDVRWKWRIGMEVVGEPITDGSTVYVTFADNTLRAYDVGRGAMHWRTALTYRPLAGPLLARTTLVLAQITPVLHAYEVKEGKPAGEYYVPVDARTLIVGQPVFAPGASFFEDAVLVAVAQGYLTMAQRGGPGVLSPFTDPGTVRPPLSLPGEAPPPTAATAAPPKP